MVKTLTLLRHAKSSWDDTVERDFDRPLNARGYRAAERMGAEIASLGLRFDQVCASPAVRVKETLAGVAKGAGTQFAPRFEPLVYLASGESLLEVVQGFDDAAATVLLVGHNPGLEDLLLLLVPEGGALRTQAALKYPTATLAAIDLPVTRWSDAAPGTGTLTRFIRPRDLDPSLGPDD